MPPSLLAFLAAVFMFATFACTSADAGVESAGVTSSATPAAASSIAASAGPSSAAQMACGNTIRQSIATTLVLKSLPTATTRWQDRLYTCRFELPDGQLTLRVREFTDVPSALQYLETARAASAPTEAIEGLANLGLPAYRSPRGIVIFLKDAMTLEVDASGLPAQLGSQRVAPTEFAYQLATNVLACWTGQH